jgi:hypothetical protein
MPRDKKPEAAARSKWKSSYDFKRRFEIRDYNRRYYQAHRDKIRNTQNTAQKCKSYKARRRERHAPLKLKRLWLRWTRVLAASRARFPHPTGARL